MADMTLATANKINIGTLTVQQHTFTVGEAVVAGAPVQLNSSDGKMYNADANLGALTTPAAPGVTTATTGGTLANSTVYSYRVSATNSAGETLPSAAATVTTGATGGAHSNTVTPAAVAGATGYKIFGRTAGTELLLATRTDATPWVDTGAVTPSGALPASNTTSTADRVWGIAGRTAEANESVTVVRRGLMEGWSNLPAYGALVYLSDTAGALADAAGTSLVTVGIVVPVWGTTLGTAADKMLLVECST